MGVRAGLQYPGGMSTNSAGMQCVRSGTALVILVCVGIMSEGCQSDVSSHLAPTPVQALRSIRVGMSREEVVSQLGEPSKTDKFDGAEFLYYRTIAILATEAQAYSPVVIENGKVVGFGTAYESTRMKLPTPSAPKRP